ncbi:hypothetical protein L6452_25865 [Arctium lappa]|uniref:Uncharacterized protein n=1 Tax=Arctium lappa TaxID=4217 RepID=A0ACB9AG41_ARCLA|nr:hypothetical protein L6452_25865 [Arctium lappa]
MPDSGRADEESVLKTAVEEFPMFNEAEGNEGGSRDSVNAEENFVGVENVGPSKENSNKACGSKVQVKRVVRPLECGLDSQIDEKRDVEVASLKKILEAQK